jgi:branched-chain amino acid transport system substrate-binding protein
MITRMNKRRAGALSRQMLWGEHMFGLTRFARICGLTAAALVALSLSSADIHAQAAPVQVVLDSSGALYLVQNNNAWSMTPNQISDGDLAQLRASGELDGAIPALFLSASDALAPLLIDQDYAGALHLVQGSNAWLLVPSPISDADLGALSIVGQVTGAISPGDLSPQPSAASPTQVPSDPAQPATPQDSDALAGQTVSIVAALPDKEAPEVADSLDKAIHMALDEVHSTVDGASVNYIRFDSANNISLGGVMSDNPRQRGPMVLITGITLYDLNAGLGTGEQQFHSVSRGEGQCGPNGLQSTYAWMTPTASIDGLTMQTAGDGPAYSAANTEPGCHAITRLAASEDVQAMAAARWAKQLGAHKVYLFYEDPWWGGTDAKGNVLVSGPAGDFKAYAQGIGLSVAGPDPIRSVGLEVRTGNAGDYSWLTQRVKASGADMVYVATDAGASDPNQQVVPFLRQLRSALGPDVKIVGSNGLYSQKLIDALGPAAEGMYVVSPSVAYNIAGGATARWYDDYRTKYGSEPNGYAIYAYETMKVALDGIRRAGQIDRAPIREAIFATRDFDGALGHWSFTDTGDVSPSTVYGRQIRNGHFDESNAVALTLP